VYWIPNSKSPPLTTFLNEYLLAHSPISYFLKRHFITVSRWFDSQQRQQNLLSFKFSVLVQGLRDSSGPMFSRSQRLCSLRLSFTWICLHGFTGTILPFTLEWYSPS
jgi:hypothetical protein